MAESDPLKQSSKKLVLFANRVLKHGSNLARNESEIGRANRNLDRRQPVLYSIKKIRGPLFTGMNF
jgi:hypothetical protein